MLGSCVVGSPNSSIDCHRDVNSTKKTIEDFFVRSSQNNPSSIKKPKNLLGYFSKDTSNSHRTDALVGSLVLEELPHVTAKNNVVKKNLLKKNPSASRSDKNSSNASSLDKKRKRVDKQVLSADEDFVENAQPKRFKSTDSVLSEESNTNTTLHSNEPLSEKTPENISNIKLKNQFDKTTDQNIHDEDDFISKKDAGPTNEIVIGCKNGQKLPKRKNIKKNSKNCISSNKKEMLKKKSKLESSKTQQSNVDKGNELNKYYSEKEEKEPSNNCKNEKEKTDSNNFSHDPNSKEISPSDSNTNRELDPPSPTDLNTKSDLTESCQPQEVEDGELNAMEFSYEEFLLSETVNEEDCVDLESTKMSREKASPSKSDSILVKKDIPDSQQVTVVADIHPEPSLNLPTAANALNSSSKPVEAVFRNVSSEVIKPKHQEDIDSIIFLDTELLNKTNEIPVSIDDASHKDQQKETTSSLDIITKKVVPNRKSKPVPNSKNQRSVVIPNSVSVKCSQSTLNFGEGNLDHNSSNSDVLVKKSKGSVKTVSKPPKIGTKTIERQLNRSIRKKNQQRDLVKYKGKNPLNGAKLNKTNKMPAVSIQPKMKNKINKRICKKKSEKISTKCSVPKHVKKSKVSPCDDKTAEVAEVKNGSTASSDGNSKDNLNPSKKSVKSKLNTIGNVGGKEISSIMTRKSLRLQERKAAPPTPSEDLEMLVEVAEPKEKENKVAPKTTLATKEKCLNNEKIPQKDGKLAPIFMKNSDKKVSKKSPKTETEEDRLRRAFLMSGLPEEAKRQQQTVNSTVSAVICDDAPFPSVSHVQQVESRPTGEINPWDLPEVNLSLTMAPPEEADGNTTLRRPPPWNGSFSVNTETPTSNTTVDHLKKFSNHSPLSASEIKTLLQEISAANPSYPVHHFYEMALKRNKVAEKSEKNSVKPEIGKEVVNVEEIDVNAEETVKGKRKGKRGLSRRKNNKKAMEIDPKPDCQKPEKIDTNSEEKVCDILWTEKYQPLHSSEIICNSSNVKKLKSWLLEWKQRTDREARRLKKLLMKQKKSKKNKEEDSNSTLSWNDDESDFASSPSESEEDSLCNTKLLTGPQGIGKTASVYALAMELGYQVFEMNASSIRSGKKILTRLQEATQSHQVSKDKYDSTLSPQPATDVQVVPQNAPSFSTFFKTSFNNAASGKISKSEKSSLSTSVAGKIPNRKRKKNQKDILPAKEVIPRCVLRKSSETGSWKKIDPVDSNLNSSLLSSSDKVSNRLNIASTSLILFDEVDIVFEEDRGFWTAILQFMSSTKRPIILTATSADFSEQFIGSCEPLHFHTPSTKTLTSHLQTLCLAENIVTKASEISDLVTYFSRDVRSCLLALQFWVDSGASGVPVNVPLSHVGRNNPSSSLIGNSNKSETESFRIQDTEKVAAGKQEEQLELKDGDASSKQEFAAHLYFLESHLAIDRLQRQFLHLENVTSETSIDANELESLVRACQCCYPQNFYLCHQIFLSRLCSTEAPFPSFDLSLRALKEKKVTKPDVSDVMQKLKSDLYDSETSCDDIICQTVEHLSGCTTDENEIKPPVKNCSEEPVVVVISKTIGDSTPGVNQKTPLSNLDENATFPSQETSSWKTLRGIAKFYDCCSDTDIFLTSCCSLELSANPNTPRSVTSLSYLSPGLWDELPIVSNELRYSQTFTEQALDIAASREVRSYLDCRRDMTTPTRTDDVKQLQQPNTSSMSNHQHYSEFVKPQLQDRSLSLARQKAVENVIHNLPISHSLHTSLLMLDYFPVLRNICRTEKIRQLAKLKRRFFHYFDNISLPLKESTLNILSSDFT